ncbi:hypothetical protein GA0070616_1344 [Micromonospora nigra]|uniref:Uncharacterized protein n=1 Tax=Micromonospora nigra TaxID=145857 RepID=A0A1C6RL15_9ACTN|nr:hypothetical protein [Micromonospora nigra]SCL17724.1 hypothetical protein GA0070616_1344 [Micromonospora nigra]
MRRVKVLPLADAQAALTATEQTLTRWTTQAAERGKAADLLAAELAEQEARAGDDLAASDDPETDLAAIADRLQRLRTEQQLSAQAAASARAQLDTARRTMLPAMAEVLRSRAKELREAATARQARTDQMLAELSAWEGVSYGPVPRRSALGDGHTWRSVPLTERITERAQWLINHADHLAHLAEHAEADQVLSAVNAGTPEMTDVERVALGVADSEPADATN